MSRPLPFSLRPPESPPSGVAAILGPTNTGKTHVAIEQMLRYDTGMIGLPLRLLAREVYDRVIQRVGEQQVALITGEERRAPPGARYLICTVEAMPLSRSVEFLAVDEIQLAGDPGRGHIFTDRLLHARGTKTTLFLGSDSMAGLMRKLVPGVSIDAQPRLSALTHRGPIKLGALPPRSAIVSFSADSVYALAERARRKFGGCAVVLGALSPRTRNAQVAMFQSGEVPVLVATDAIGMGLNLEIEHVAFAQLFKFDGTRSRKLHIGELAQIAGRAGRYQTDGTFGVTESCEPLDEHTWTAIEEHRIPSVHKLYWRATDLDFSSLPSLHESLLALPPGASSWFQRRNDDDDELVFRLLARHPDVVARATHPTLVELLWEVCRTPNYRRQLPEHHAELLRRVFMRLVDNGTMAAGWVRRSIDTLDRIDAPGPGPGEQAGSAIDVLTERLASIRTWSYLSQRSDWVEQAGSVREHARDVEDRLSDALHLELQARFVDRRAEVRAPGGHGVVTGDEVRVGQRVVGTLEGLGFRTVDGSSPTPTVRAAVEPAVALRVQALLTDPAGSFGLGDDLCLHWLGSPVARLMPGPVPAEPRLKLMRSEWLRPSDQMQIERRLTAILRDLVTNVLAPLRPAGQQRGGVCYLLEAGLGTVPIERVAPARAGLSEVDRRAMARFGVRFGAVWAWSNQMVGRERRVLAAIATGLDAVPDCGDGEVVPVSEVGRSPFWALAGMIRLGDHAIRVDLYEAWTAEVRARARSGTFVPPEILAERLGNPAVALRELGMMPVQGIVGLWGRRRR